MNIGVDVVGHPVRDAGTNRDRFEAIRVLGRQERRDVAALAPTHRAHAIAVDHALRDEMVDARNARPTRRRCPDCARSASGIFRRIPRCHDSWVRARARPAPARGRLGNSRHCWNTEPAARCRSVRRGSRPAADSVDPPESPPACAARPRSRRRPDSSSERPRAHASATTRSARWCCVSF